MADKNKLVDTFTHKLGPLPVWVWGIMAGVSINVARYYFNKRNDSPTVEGEGATPPLDGEAKSAVTSGTSVGQRASSGFDSAAYAGSASSAPLALNETSGGNTSVPRWANMDAWRRDVSDQLIAEGNDPGVVVTALAKYTNGEPVSVAEAAVIRLALRKGSPPEGAPAIIAEPVTPSGPGQGGKAPDPLDQPDVPEPQPTGPQPVGYAPGWRYLMSDGTTRPGVRPTDGNYPYSDPYPGAGQAPYGGTPRDPSQGP